MATFVSHGNIEHVDELQKFFEDGDLDLWTVNRNARPGDTVVFYIKAPVSAFVAVGRVHSEPFEDDGDYGWDGHYMADVSVEHVVDPPLKRTAALEYLPQWKWLKSPQAPARVPDDVEAKLLKLFQLSTIEEDNEGELGGGAGFGADPIQNKAVEQAAVNAVWDWFLEEGWSVTDRQRDNCGYDLLCRNGSKEQHVEIKGISGNDLCFIITQNELSTAKRDPHFLLTVVTNALVASRLEMYDFNGRELLTKFAFEPLAFKARRR